VLMQQLVSLELFEEDAYFKGLRGYGSTTFLAMCVEFANIIRREGKISRSYVLYMLSTMYNGRQKPFASLSTGKGLIGILGSIPVLSRPLLRTTDNPEEISTFMLVDLPILDLTPDIDGELFACAVGGIVFDQSPASLNWCYKSTKPKQGMVYTCKDGPLIRRRNVRSSNGSAL